MKITCEKCGTVFKMDDSLVKDTGTKVRCSVCKHVFTVYPSQKEPVREEQRPVPEQPETTNEDIQKSEQIPDETEDIKEEQKTEKDNKSASIPVPDQKESPEEDKTSESEDSLERPEEGPENDFATEDQEDFDGLNSEDWDDINKEEDDLQPSLAEDEAKDKKEDEAKNEEEDEHESSEKDDEKEEKQEDKSGKDKKNNDKQKASFFSHGIMILVVIICILLAGTAAIYFFAPSNRLPLLSKTTRHKQHTPPSHKKQKPDPGIAHLTFESVSGLFVTSDTAGRLFVIKGFVKNNYSHSRSFIRIKGKILDEKHQPIRTKVVFAGTTLGKNEISTLSQAEIDKIAKNRFGDKNQNVNIPPSGTVPFIIIFSNLPDNMSEFTVEAVSSSPGTSQ